MVFFIVKENLILTLRIVSLLDFGVGKVYKLAKIIFFELVKFIFGAILIDTFNFFIGA